MTSYFIPTAKKDLPMGIEDYKIKDRDLTASSEWDKYHAARFARLNSVARGKNKGAWSAKRNNRGQWIMVSVFFHRLLKFQPFCLWFFSSLVDNILLPPF